MSTIKCDIRIKLLLICIKCFSLIIKFVTKSYIRAGDSVDQQHTTSEVCKEQSILYRTIMKSFVPIFVLVVMLVVIQMEGTTGEPVGRKEGRDRPSGPEVSKGKYDCLIILYCVKDY